VAGNNQIREKSYVFALNIVRAAKVLQDGKEFVLSKQLLRAGTSIGANVEEAGAAQSKKDFIAKMSVASKEARETHYWLRILGDVHYLDDETSKKLLDDCLELIRLLTAIVKTAQANVRTNFDH
jgi:four helix bundle protein